MCTVIFLRPFHQYVFAQLCVPLVLQAFTQCSGMQDQDQDVFFHNMTSATLFQMPKLLACYEYYVALHSVDGSRPGLIVQCASEQQLSRSWPRIAKGICMAFQSLASQASRFQNGICTICPPTKRTCECDRGLSTPLEPWEFLPRPMDFFKMAQAAPE